MIAFRKFAIVCLTALALVGPALLPQQFQATGGSAQAAAPVRGYYHVYCRLNSRCQWEYCGYSPRLADANAEVLKWRRWGHQAMYVFRR